MCEEGKGFHVQMSGPIHFSSIHLFPRWSLTPFHKKKRFFAFPDSADLLDPLLM